MAAVASHQAAQARRHSRARSAGRHHGRDGAVDHRADTEAGVRRVPPDSSSASSHSSFSRWTYAQVDGFIANSRVISDRLVTDGVPRAKITIVNEGVDVERIERLQPANVRAAFYLPMQAPVVGNVAALVPHKGQHHLIDAAAIAVRQVPDARFVIVGDGELRHALEEQIRHKHLERHVFLAGFRDDALELTKGFDLFVMSSTSEGMCTALVDAMAASKAAVDDRRGRDPRSDGRWRDRISGADPRPQAMAARIVQLLKNPKLRARMGEAALQRARERFTVDRMVDGTQAAYESLLLAEAKSQLTAARGAVCSRNRRSGSCLVSASARAYDCARVGHSSKATAQIGSRRMREVVLVEIAAGEDRIDDRQPRRRTVAHRDRRGAIQLDDRRRIGAQQHVVQADDLRPVRVGGRSRFGMHGGNRRLQRVRTEPAAGQRPLDERAALGNLLAVPARAVLIVEQHQLA